MSQTQNHPPDSSNMDQDPDDQITIHPPHDHSSSSNPNILKTRHNKLRAIAPGFTDLQVRVWVPNTPNTKPGYHPQQIIRMKPLVWDENGEDVTWLATQMFLAWLESEDGAVVTDVDGQKLSLDVLSSCARAVGSVEYTRCIEAAKQCASLEEVEQRGEVEEMASDLVDSVRTEVEGFVMVEAEDSGDEAVVRLQQSVEIGRPDSDNDSERSTHLP